MVSPCAFVRNSVFDTSLLTATLKRWSDIPSGTDCVSGVLAMADELQGAFAGLGHEVHREVLLPYTALDGSKVAVGPLLRVQARPEARFQVLLLGHMDTVYGDGRLCKPCFLTPDARLHGPGVADMKGGLLILLETLRLIENSPWRDGVGWQVLLTPDEETGSHASRSAIYHAAAQASVGLVFESALPDGSLVRKRMGNGTYQINVSGQAAHTGRDFARGRNAIVAACRLCEQLAALNQDYSEALFNVGKIQGGGALNVVPDQCQVWLSVRIGSVAVQRQLEQRLPQLFDGLKGDGIDVSWHGGFVRPPVEESAGNAALHAAFGIAAGQLGLPVPGWRDTGGSSDGNFLADAGLPFLDGIGVLGGNIHSPDEFALVDSLPDRIRCNALFILNQAQLY